MANVKISELPAAAAALAAMQIEVNDAGVSRRVTVQQAFELLVGATDGLLVRNAAGATVARTLTTSSSTIALVNGNGVSGNPTIDLNIASQAEAEAGTATNRLMTPQRVAQAITAQVSGAGGGWALYDTVYSFGSDGQIASAQSIDLADGYDYRVVFDEVKGHKSDAGKFITVQALIEETAQWSPAVALTTAAMLEDITAKFCADLLLPAPRRARRSHTFSYMGTPIALDGKGRATTTKTERGRDQSYSVTTTSYGPPNVGATSGTLVVGGELAYDKLGLIFNAARRFKALRFAWSTCDLAGGSIKLLRQVAQN